MKLGKAFKKLSKIGKTLAPILKVAAPIAASFVPGGSIAMNVISKVAAARSKAAPALTLAKRVMSAKNHSKGFPGLPSYDNREAVMSDSNGLTGRVGRVHARQIAAMRRTRPTSNRGYGIGTRATYNRARALRPRMAFKGGMRAYGGHRAVMRVY